MRFLKCFILAIVILFFNVHSEAAEVWKELKGNHFIIYYQNAPLDFIKTANESAEQYYEEITRNLGFTRYAGWVWEERAKIYVYDNNDAYVQSKQNLKWSSGEAFIQNKVIRTFPQAVGFFDSTLPHEMGHLIFREFVGQKAQVPLWFEEGVAMYQEKAKRYGANDAVRQAIKAEQFLSIKELNQIKLNNNTDQNKVNLFYAESASIVYYMITELGEFRFEQFCRELQKERPFEYTLSSVYVRFRDLDQLNKAWLDYLQK